MPAQIAHIAEPIDKERERAEVCREVAIAQKVDANSSSVPKALFRPAV
jgi:hypothetical protein